MASKENDKKQSSGLKNFVKSLLAVSPGAQAAFIAKGIGQEVKRRKKKPVKKKPTGNIAKEAKVRGDKAAQKSFLGFVESELKSQNPKPKK